MRAMALLFAGSRSPAARGRARHGACTGPRTPS